MRVCSISDGIVLIVYSAHEAQLSCSVRQESYYVLHGSRQHFLPETSIEYGIINEIAVLS